MKIADFDLRNAERPLVVCELGAAHNGSVEAACRLIELAAAAGADACKVQAFTPNTITADFDRPEFTIRDGPWAGRRLYDLYAQAHTPREWFPQLITCAAAFKMPIFPSVFSIEDIEFVKQFEPPALKIASFELVDPILIKAAMWQSTPLILSTGMANWGEISEAAKAVRNHPSVWLHCISSYPTDVEKANLSFMDVLRRQHDYVGLSDHTRGHEVAQMAVARGACMIEKHMTLTPDGPGLDDKFASGPEEFAQFVKAVWRAAAALGVRTHDWRSSARDDSEHAPLRRSLYVMENIKEGERITAVNVRSIRPGLGMAPKFFPQIMGRRAAMDIPAGTPLAEHHILGGLGT
jgi:sialic acid synthase SpsE